MKMAEHTTRSEPDLHSRHDHNQYLTFMLGSETLAIGILAIKEIIEYGSITDVPMMPPFIRGVINLRGSVVPVIDLSARFSRPSSPVTKKTCIVIVEADAHGERQVIGIVVDAVNAVIEIPAQDVEPPPSFGASIRADLIGGMGRVDGRFIVILRVDRVLSTEDLTALGQLGNGAVPDEIAGSQSLAS